MMVPPLYLRDCNDEHGFRCVGIGVSFQGRMDNLSYLLLLYFEVVPFQDFSTVYHLCRMVSGVENGAPRHGLNRFTMSCLMVWTGGVTSSYRQAERARQSLRHHRLMGASVFIRFPTFFARANR